MKQIFTIEMGISTIVAQPLSLLFLMASTHNLHLIDLPPIAFHVPPLDLVVSIWAKEMVESKKLESAMAELRRGERERERLWWEKQKIERGATAGVGGGERRLTMSLRTSAMAEQGRETKRMWEGERERKERIKVSSSRVKKEKEELD